MLSSNRSYRMNRMLFYYPKDRGVLGVAIFLLMMSVKDKHAAALITPTVARAENLSLSSSLDKSATTVGDSLPKNLLWGHGAAKSLFQPDGLRVQSESEGRLQQLDTMKQTSQRTTPQHELGLQQNPRENDDTSRLSFEEEKELSLIIREGARLRDIQRLFESQHGRDISRAEWAQLANMSEKKLRRAVMKYRDAKSTLVMANIGLVHAVVNQMCNKSGRQVNKDELVQEGSLGLIRAAELFDPSKGLKFSTYAMWWIKGVLSNSKAFQFVAVPTREKVKHNLVTRAIQTYEREHNGRRPAAHEVASMCNLKQQEVEVLLQRMSKIKVLSLDHVYGSSSNDKTELYGDAALRTGDDYAETLQMKADVVTAISRNLDGREALLLRLRYGLTKDGKTRSLVECAEEMGISRSRAQQLASQSLQKLREAQDVSILQEYLHTIA